MARMGVASRRKCEELIEGGHVKVNGKLVTHLGTKVNAEIDRVTVNGRELAQPRFLYLALNKPKGCITSVSDPHDRDTVMRYLPQLEAPVKPIGRLDYSTEGLLLFSNDGDLIQRLTHPKHTVEKVYVAHVLGVMTERQMNRLRRGVVLDGKRTSPAGVSLISVDREKRRSVIEISIHEGRNRQIKRMFEEVCSKVIALRRTKVGPITVGKLRPGECRMLTKREVARLKQLTSG